MRATIPVIDAITAGWDAAFPMFGLKILRIFYALRSKGCEAIHKINTRLYSWKRMKNLAKSSDCATNTDTTPVLAASSTATAIFIQTGE